MTLQSCVLYHCIAVFIHALSSLVLCPTSIHKCDISSLCLCEIFNHTCTQILLYTLLCPFMCVLLDYVLAIHHAVDSHIVYNDKKTGIPCDKKKMLYCLDTDLLKFQVKTWYLVISNYLK